jgi:hypothetical protein
MSTSHNFDDTHSFVVERLHDGNELVCYFKAWGGMKSNDPDVPDDSPEVEVWAYTVRCPGGNEVRIDAFNFTEGWDEELYINGYGNADPHQYILDNLQELTS